MKNLSMHPAVTADTSAILALNMNEAITPQVIDHIKSLGDLSNTEVIGLPGQAVAAIICLPIFEMTCGLPHNVSMVGFGADAKVAGSIDLDAFRHNIVRPHRAEIAQGDAFTGYTVLDGAGRGLTADQLAELAASLNVAETEIRLVNVSPGQVNLALHCEEQERLAAQLVATGLNWSDWTSGRLIYLPTGHGGVAAVQATAIYGLAEVWPRVIRLNRAEDGSFHLAEVVDPQAGRQIGVALKAEWAKGNTPILVSRDLIREAIAALTEAGKADLADKLSALIA